jgi:hypothetical protein
MHIFAIIYKSEQSIQNGANLLTFLRESLGSFCQDLTYRFLQDGERSMQGRSRGNMNWGSAATQPAVIWIARSGPASQGSEHSRRRIVLGRHYSRSSANSSTSGGRRRARERGTRYEGVRS